MIVAIHQPNYLPWLGYFQKIAQSDIFVFLDDVQFTKGGYTNRVQIAELLTPGWLTIPTRPKLGTSIDMIKVNASWCSEHLARFRSAYRSSRYFDDVFDMLRTSYAALTDPEDLALSNMQLIQILCERLSLDTAFKCSSELLLPQGVSGDARLSHIVNCLTDEGIYLSGQGGQKYQNGEMFQNSGVALRYVSVSIPEYTRGEIEYVPGLSVVDCLFHQGWDRTSSIIANRTPV